MNCLKNLLRRAYLRFLGETYYYCLNRNFKKYFIQEESKKDAVVLAGFTRAGTTFVRLIWLNIINLLERKVREIDFVVVEDEMPYENHFKDLKKKWKYKSLPCLLKTHNLYEDRHKGLKVIHLFRNPLDSMVASYDYQMKKVEGAHADSLSWLEKNYFAAFVQREERTFSEHLRDHFNSYCRFFKSWKQEGFIPVSYESLMTEDCPDVIHDVLERLGHKIDKEVVQQAVALCTKDKMKNKKMSDKMALLKHRGFIRTRYVGEWKEYFSDDDLAYVRERLAFYGLDKKELFPEEYHDLLNEWPIE